MLALVIGLVVTAALTVTAQALYNRNENRVLRLRIKEAEQVIGASLPTVQIPLASAAALADATNGNKRKFKAFIKPYVGVGPNRPFVSVSLWRLPSIAHGPKVFAGSYPQLSRAAAASFLKRADSTSQLSVMGMLNDPAPRVGYALTAHGPSRYVAYGESHVSRSRYSPGPPNSAFSDLDYAIYLGASPLPQNLLLTNVAQLPIRGDHQMVTLPFGTSFLTLVMAPRRALGGTLPQTLPWIIAGTGVLLTLLASLLMLRLARGRENAQRLALTLEEIAAENRRLYGEQRDIAQTLQHSLLPEELPSLPGVEVSARYKAGEKGVEIGGDWYDVITLGDDRVLMIVGDVSGRGLRAATTMAALRHAIHAYAAENDPPGTILTKLSRLHSVVDDGKLATVMCAVLDLPAHRVTLASAGHLPPLLLDPEGGQFLYSPVGAPIGMEPGGAYRTKTYTVAPGATLLAFTDGLVERRGETLDQGLARLRTTALSNGAALPDLLESLLNHMRGDPIEDDTALVGIRWRA